MSTWFSLAPSLPILISTSPSTSAEGNEVWLKGEKRASSSQAAFRLLWQCHQFPFCWPGFGSAEKFLAAAGLCSSLDQRSAKKPSQGWEPSFHTPEESTSLPCSQLNQSRCQKNRNTSNGAKVVVLLPAWAFSCTAMSRTSSIQSLSSLPLTPQQQKGPLGLLSLEGSHPASQPKANLCTHFLGCSP